MLDMRQNLNRSVIGISSRSISLSLDVDKMYPQLFPKNDSSCKKSLPRIDAARRAKNYSSLME